MTDADKIANIVNYITENWPTSEMYLNATIKFDYTPNPTGMTTYFTIDCHTDWMPEHIRKHRLRNEATTENTPSGMHKPVKKRNRLQEPA